MKADIEEGNELPVSEEDVEAVLAEMEKDPHEHSGGTATCISPAICSSDDCGQAYGEKDAANHTGGTEIRDKTEATCASAGYTGDVFCRGCNTMIEEGRTIAATGNHPAAVCGAPGHHAHDGRIHAVANCGILGHCILDGKNHAPASCGVKGHYNCDGEKHENCTDNPDAAK